MPIDQTDSPALPEADSWPASGGVFTVNENYMIDESRISPEYAPDLNSLHGELLEPQMIHILSAEWVTWLDVKPKTSEVYIKSLKFFSEWMRGNGILEPTHNDIVRWKKTLVDTKSVATVNQYLRAVKAFYHWLEARNLRADIAKDIALEHRSKRFRKESLSPKQCAELLSTKDDADTEKNLRDKAMMALMMTTGLRTIEVAGANIGDLSLKGDMRVLYIQGKGRNEKDEFVKVPDEAFRLIQEYLNVREQVESVQSPLFASVSRRDKGCRLTTRSVSRICKTALLEMGIDSPKYTAHSLRHTAATTALKAGASVEQVQQVLRHANINTTMIYVHEIEREKNAPEDLAASAIFQAVENNYYGAEN